jgi:hypothetical protein
MEDGEKLESDRRAVATALRLVLVSVPIIGLVIYYGMQRTPPASTSAPAVESHAPTPEVPAAQPPPEPVPAADVSTPAPTVTPQTSGLSMEIAPRATCWVSVNTDGEQVFSGLMNAGDKRSVTAKDQIALNVGDAGAFAYTLNGRVGKPLGAPGEVVSARITVANIQQFVIP